MRKTLSENGWVISAYLLWSLVITFTIFTIVLRLPLDQTEHSWYQLLIRLWGNWDGGHYVTIAEKGYEPVQYAFFPLFPLLIRISHELTCLSYPAAGVLVSRLSLVIGLIFFYKLAKFDFGEAVARRAIFYLLAFPTAFFLLAVYTEPLFLLLSVGAFCFARQKNWLFCGIFGFFASLTRATGILLFPALIWEVCHLGGLSFRRPEKKEILFLLLCPLGLLAYMIYQKVTIGSFFQFVEAQKVWAVVAGRTGFTSPLLVLSRELEKTLRFSFSGGYAITLFDFLFSLSSLLLIITSFWNRKLRKSYLIFALLCWFLPVFSGSLVSMPRFTLLMFPLFFLLGLWGENDLFNLTYLGLALLLQANFLTSFVYQWWVA